VSTSISTIVYGNRSFSFYWYRRDNYQVHKTLAEFNSQAIMQVHKRNRKMYELIQDMKQNVKFYVQWRSRMSSGRVDY
jgi:uncharacterized protein YgiM (DUF1202 family)